MATKKDAPWVVQIDKNTGKERDDYYYLYCKEHNLPCASKPFYTETVPDKDLANHKREKRQKRETLDELSMYRMHTEEGFTFEEIAEAYNCSVQRAQQVIERVKFNSEKSVRMEKAEIAKEKRNARIEKLFLEGMSVRDIAVKCGCSHQTVYSALRDVKDLERQQRLERNESIKQQYAEGKTTRWLAEFYELHIATIRIILHEGDY